MTDATPLRELEPGESGPVLLDTVDGDVVLAMGGAEDPAQPLDQDEQSGDGAGWDEHESEALRRGRREAELVVSADSVRAYLKRIGKVALLDAA